MRAMRFAAFIVVNILQPSAKMATYVDDAPPETPDETYAELAACISQKGPTSKMSRAEIDAASKDWDSRAKGLTLSEFTAMGFASVPAADDQIKARCIAAIDKKLRPSFASGGPPVSQAGITGAEVDAISHSCASFSGEAERSASFSGLVKLGDLTGRPVTHAVIGLSHGKNPSPAQRKKDEPQPEAVPIVRKGEVYMVRFRINDAITLNFIIDSGASDVAIPADVALTLIRPGTIAETDLFGRRTYQLADGSQLENHPRDEGGKRGSP